MTEFSIINQYCRNVGTNHQETRLSVGDDAAIVSIPAGHELVVSVDTMVESVHFLPNAAADEIGHKLLAVNLSDMAAMGAIPKWVTIALTMPAANETWVKQFIAGFEQLAKQHQVQLIGGDMTQGALTISLQIMGIVATGTGLTRSAARLGDDVYVTGNIGDAALCLLKQQQGIAVDKQSALYQALHSPTAQVTFGQSLNTLANSAIDISDGLVADLSHIAKASSVSLRLDISKVPLSADYQQWLSQGGNVDLALTGGDDYQLAFTASVEQRESIQAVAEKLDIKLSRIGAVTEQQDQAVLLFENDSLYTVQKSHGFVHFSSD